MYTLVLLPILLGSTAVSASIASRALVARDLIITSLTTRQLSPSDIPPQCQTQCNPIVTKLGNSCATDLTCLCSRETASQLQSCVQCGIDLTGASSSVIAQAQGSLNQYTQACAAGGQAAPSLTVTAGSGGGAGPTATGGGGGAGTGPGTGAGTGAGTGTGAAGPIANPTLGGTTPTATAGGSNPTITAAPGGNTGASNPTIGNSGQNSAAANSPQTQSSSGNVLGGGAVSTGVNAFMGIAGVAVVIAML